MKELLVYPIKVESLGTTFSFTYKDEEAFGITINAIFFSDILTLVNREDRSFLIAILSFLLSFQTLLASYVSYFNLTRRLPLRHLASPYKKLYKESRSLIWETALEMRNHRNCSVLIFFCIHFLLTTGPV